MTIIDYPYFLESNECLILINTQPITNTRFPISYAITMIPNPAQQSSSNKTCLKIMMDMMLGTAG